MWVRLLVWPLRVLKIEWHLYSKGTVPCEFWSHRINLISKIFLVLSRQIRPLLHIYMAMTTRPTPDTYWRISAKKYKSFFGKVKMSFEYCCWQIPRSLSYVASKRRRFTIIGSLTHWNCEGGRNRTNGRTNGSQYMTMHYSIFILKQLLCHWFTIIEIYNFQIH